MSVPHALGDRLLLQLPQLPLRRPARLVNRVVCVVGFHLRPHHANGGEHGDLRLLQLRSLGLVLRSSPARQTDVYSRNRRLLSLLHVVVVQHEMHRGLLHLRLHIVPERVRHLQVSALDVQPQSVGSPFSTASLALLSLALVQERHALNTTFTGSCDRDLAQRANKVRRRSLWPCGANGMERVSFPCDGTREAAGRHGSCHAPPAHCPPCRHHHHRSRSSLSSLVVVVCARALLTSISAFLSPAS